MLGINCDTHCLFHELNVNLVLQSKVSSKANIFLLYVAKGMIRAVQVKIKSVRNEGILSDERFVRNSFEEFPHA